MSEIETRLAESCDLGLDQLAHYSGLEYARVRQWADGDADIDEEETVRLTTIISLFHALHERLMWAGEVLYETFGKPGKNGTVH